MQYGGNYHFASISLKFATGRVLHATPFTSFSLNSNGVLSEEVFQFHVWEIVESIRLSHIKKHVNIWHDLNTLLARFRIFCNAFFVMRSESKVDYNTQKSSK